jgi:hypothetical protein
VFETTAKKKRAQVVEGESGTPIVHQSSQQRREWANLGNPSSQQRKEWVGQWHKKEVHQSRTGEKRGASIKNRGERQTIKNREEGVGQWHKKEVYQSRTERKEWANGNGNQEQRKD